MANINRTTQKSITLTDYQKQTAQQAREDELQQYRSYCIKKWDRNHFWVCVGIVASVCLGVGLLVYACLPYLVDVVLSTLEKSKW